MEKPRIIIADTDSRYILPLQARFVEAYFEKIDLEIITDRNFFAGVFITPQKADILIVSEDLYDPSLLRHNISHIFLMMEKADENENDNPRVHRIFKYTSIKEIFNEIAGRSAGTLSVNIGNKSEPQIVLVCSACGGTGKTTIALGMAACLAQNYKKVLYINASWLQTFQRFLENSTAISTMEVYSKLSDPSVSVYNDIRHVLRNEQFTYLPPFKASLMSLGLDYSIYEKIAQSAKRSDEFDFIVVDCDTEFDEAKVSLINAADKVVIVTKQSASSVFATNMLVANINGISSEKYIFVCNDFKKEEDNALISTTMPSRFTVSEYIGHMNQYDSLRIDDLANDNGIREASVLII